MGKGALPSPKDLRCCHPSAGGLGTQGPPRERPSPSAPNPAPNTDLLLSLCILVPAIRVGGPRPPEPPPHLPSSPGAQASHFQGQAPPLPSAMGSAGRATAQMLRATPDLFLSEE